MPLHDDVVKIGKKLDKMASSGTVDQAQAKDILMTLKKLPMRLDVLQKTRIGMTVNSFRKKCTDDEVVTLAKSLIKSWKKCLPESGSSKGKDTQAESKEEKEETEDNGDEKKEGESEKKEEAPPRRASLPDHIEDTNDPIRVKCRELLATALRTKPFPEDGADPDHCAAAIEDCIFEEFGNTEMKYKTRVRSRVANLKDSRNPKLRENVLIGLIPCERIANMTAEEMASDEMKRLREKLTKEAIDDYQMATNSGTVTDLFKCGRCGKRSCTYNQLQTRSADEPMTTFVCCNECGNRWKFC